jgi:SAM-dependent methyltransferase
MGIAEDYCSQIGPGHRVLEIGCGTWSPIKDHCVQVGAVYEGIDAQETYYGIPSIANRIENLADLSYPDESFDFVIGNQTMEHWAEFGCPTEWGLYQCFRAAKPGGAVFLNVPMNFHGSFPFLLGREDKIKDLFRPFTESLVLEAWGRDPSPLAPFTFYHSYWALRDRHAYILDLRAKRDLPLKKRARPLLASNQALGRALHYPLSFNIYRIGARLGLWKRDRAPELP